MNAPLDDEDNGEWKVRSKVVSVSIGSSKQHKQLSSPVKITLETTEVGTMCNKINDVVSFWGRKVAIMFSTTINDCVALT